MQWVKDNAAEIKESGKKQLFGNGEFKVHPSCQHMHAVSLTSPLPSSLRQVVVWGEGVQEEQHEGQALLWQLEGEAEVTCGRGSGRLSGHSCTLTKAGEK